MIRKLISNMMYKQNLIIKLGEKKGKKNLRFFDIHNVRIVSSVSARKLKCPSSARLSSKTSQLGLARAGKFQLEPITITHLFPQYIY